MTIDTAKIEAGTISDAKISAAQIYVRNCYVEGGLYVGYENPTRSSVIFSTNMPRPVVEENLWDRLCKLFRR